MNNLSMAILWATSLVIVFILNEEISSLKSQLAEAKDQIEVVEGQLVKLVARAEKAEAERDHAEAILEYQVRSESNTPAWALMAKFKAERDALAAKIEQWKECKKRYQLLSGEYLVRAEAAEAKLKESAAIAKWHGELEEAMKSIKEYETSCNDERENPVMPCECPCCLSRRVLASRPKPESKEGI